MKLTMLVEDIKTEGFRTEHGLSIHIQDGDNAYLLDVGQSGKFIQNADKLGIDIAKVKAVFISHNHYDHIGGLNAFFKVNKTATVYIKEEAKQRAYAKEGWAVIPVDGRPGVMKKNIARFVFIKDHLTVDAIDLLSDTVGEKHYFCQDDRLMRKKDGKFVQDDFTHEMFLAIKSKGKMHVLSPCSHRGIVNILSTVKKTYDLPLGTVIGGFHMSKNGGKAMNCTESYLDDVAEKLKGFEVENLYTGHCTGLYAYGKLKEKLKENIGYAKTGDVFEI
ncbi:MAG: MBL fold metallo-hydrolase [Eubacteriales bacterium]